MSSRPSALAVTVSELADGVAAVVAVAAPLTGVPIPSMSSVVIPLFSRSAAAAARSVAVLASCIGSDAMTVDMPLAACAAALSACAAAWVAATVAATCATHQGGVVYYSELGT